MCLGSLAVPGGPGSDYWVTSAIWNSISLAFFTALTASAWGTKDEYKIQVLVITSLSNTLVSVGTYRCTKIKCLPRWMVRSLPKTSNDVYLVSINSAKFSLVV